MEADLARYYPRTEDQLPEFYRGRMSLRRLWVLVHGLPRDSSTYERIAGPEVAAWTPVVESLASVVDTVRELDYHLVTGFGGKTSPPKRVERPKGVGDGADTRLRPPGNRQA